MLSFLHWDRGLIFLAKHLVNIFPLFVGYVRDVTELTAHD